MWEKEKNRRAARITGFFLEREERKSEQAKKERSEDLRERRNSGDFWDSEIILRKDTKSRGRREGRGILWLSEVERCRRAGKRRLQPSLYQVRFLFFWSFYFLLFWYSRLHSTLDSLAVFWEVILADWSGHWGPLYLHCWIEIFLQACSIMIVFLISLILFL